MELVPLNSNSTVNLLVVNSKKRHRGQAYSAN
jgi:hypothetical protein